MSLIDKKRFLFILFIFVCMGCKTEKLRTPDGGILNFEIIDASDNRGIPYGCGFLGDCQDNDPCTIEACSNEECSYEPQEDLLDIVDHIELIPMSAALDVAITSNRLYVAEGESGFEIYDISDLNNIPIPPRRIDVAGEVLAIEANDQGVVVSKGSAGIEVFTSPDYEPVAAIDADNGELRGLDDVVGVDFGPSHSIISGFTDGLVVMDLASIATPVGQSWVQTPGRVLAAASSRNDCGVVADALGGMHTIAFETEAGSVIARTLETTGRVVDIDMKGNTVLTAEYGIGFSVIDASDCFNPDRLVVHPTGSPCIGVSLLGPQTAVIVEENGRVSIYDIAVEFTGTDFVGGVEYFPSSSADFGGNPSKRPDLMKPVLLSSIDVVSGNNALNVDSFNGIIAVALGTRGVALIQTGCR